MSRFHECLALTLREESGEIQPVGGPYVRGRYSFMNHPKDPGGATMMGVTHRVYAAYRRSMGRPPQDVREVTDEEIEAIYRHNYWEVVAGDSLPRGLDLAVFDFAVNSGPHRAITKLQSVLGVKVDGLLGIATFAAAAEAEPDDLIRRYMQARRDFCRRIPHYPSFKNGWTRRWDRIEAASILRAAEVEPTTPPPIPVVDAGPEIPAPRAIEEAPTSMAKSDTGNMALASAGGGVTTVGVTAAQAAKSMKVITLSGFLLELASRPEFWAGMVVVFGAAFVWLERRRKMLMEG